MARDRSKKRTKQGGGPSPSFGSSKRQKLGAPKRPPPSHTQVEVKVKKHLLAAAAAKAEQQLQQMHEEAAAAGVPFAHLCTPSAVDEALQKVSRLRTLWGPLRGPSGFFRGPLEAPRGPLRFFTGPVGPFWGP